MITNAGGSFSRWKDLAVTRSAPRRQLPDDWGTFCYIRRWERGILVHSLSGRHYYQQSAKSSSPKDEPSYKHQLMRPGSEPAQKRAAVTVSCASAGYGNSVSAHQFYKDEA